MGKNTYVATAYNNIGNAYHSQGNFAQAMECHKKALHIRRKVFGEEHPDVAMSYGNVGIVYYSQGDYVKALENLQKALDIMTKALGEEHLRERP